MMQTVKAVIDEKGTIQFLEPIKPGTFQHVLVTILPSSNQPDKSSSRTNIGSVETLDDDLEGASREIAETFKNALDRQQE